MSETVAEHFASTLAAIGVKRVYGVVGDSLNALTDAMRRQGKIEWIAVRHEEVAAFAAGADAHLTGTIAVCAGSCGPGNTHLINGLYDCHRSRVPVLAIAAHIPTPEIGSGYFQETHPQELFRECSHYCEQITAPSQMPRTLEIAIREAIGKRGVSVVVLPGDVAQQKAAKAYTPSVDGLLLNRPKAVPVQGDVQKLAAMINAGKKVTLLCGAGCEGSHAQLLALGERLSAPMVYALRGKEFVEPNNPYEVGMTGLIGFSSGHFAMNDCDVLVMLGTDFPYRQFFPDGGKTKIAQVDLRPEQIGRRASVDLGVVGDIESTLEALLPLLEKKTDTSHLTKAREHYKKVRAELDSQAQPTTADKKIYPEQIAAAFNRQAADDAIFTCDVGLPTVWAARFLAMNGKRRLVGSFWHGSMANAMAQSVGAQAAFPNRQVISFSGDGGFSMLMGDFLTIAQAGLPVKIVIFNNASLGFVEIEQKSVGLLPTGVDLKNPNFAAMANAIGIKGIRLEDSSDVERGIAEALAHDGPVLIDAVVTRNELPIPPHITLEMAKGFTLYMLRAVMNGRGNEIIDLAKTNLWH